MSPQRVSVTPVKRVCDMGPPGSFAKHSEISPTKKLMNGALKILAQNLAHAGMKLIACHQSSSEF